MAEHELAECREQCAKAERKTADVLAEGKAENRAESRMVSIGGVGVRWLWWGASGEWRGRS